MLGFSAVGEPLTDGAAHAEKLGWRLGVQAYCFNKIDFLSMVDRLERIGVRYVEAYPGQMIGGEFAKVRFDQNMPAEARAAMKARLADAGVTLVNIGVVPLPNDEAKCRDVFEFAKEMGVDTIVSEPPVEALPLIDKLCAEYGIDVAIHNHPEPSAYWNPETVMAAIEDRSERIGVCADTSHWMRSGVDVLAWLKRFEGRLKCFHFGDVQPEALRAFEEKMAVEGVTPSMVAHIREVPNAVYGQGAGDMRAWLEELHRQRVEALFCVEAFFELEADVTEEKIVECVRWFDGVAQELGGE
ncbi:MAG: sugar phosphate isomerase/epimerase [Candidatus Hydrogenedentales bacterium]